MGGSLRTVEAPVVCHKKMPLQITPKSPPENPPESLPEGLAERVAY